MWFHLGFREFLAKTSCKDDFCDIFISDCLHIWHKTLSNNELLSISQTLNPLLEVSVSKLMEITLNSLKDANAKKEVEIEGSCITLKIESNILGLKFRLMLILSQGNTEMLYKEFTVPLLIILIKMQNREKELIKIIEDKDVEISEYKQEIGNIRSHLVTTKPFSKKEFDSQHPVRNLNENLNSFFECITKLLPSENACKDEDIQPGLIEREDKSVTAKKNEKKLSIFMDKSSNQKTNSKSFVGLDNQTLKKKIKLQEKAKLKF